MQVEAMRCEIVMRRMQCLTRLGGRALRIGLFRCIEISLCIVCAFISAPVVLRAQDVSADDAYRQIRTIIDQGDMAAARRTVESYLRIAPRDFRLLTFAVEVCSRSGDKRSAYSY